MGLVQPPRPRRSIVDQFGAALAPGGGVQRGAGAVAAALARSQLEGLDPRTWNDRVAPQYDAQGREVHAGVVLPMWARPGSAPQLGRLFDLDYKPKPLNYGNKEALREYPLPIAERSRQEPVDYSSLDELLGLGPQRNVSWDTGKKPLPPPSAGKQALDTLLEKLRPKQMKQLKMVDDDSAFDDIPEPNWWDADHPLRDLGNQRWGQAGASPLEHDNPRLFRPIANHPLSQEEWIAKHSRDVGGNRLPGVGPRDDAIRTLNEAGGRIARIDRQQLRRVREGIAANRDSKLPPPRHPSAYDENYFRGAELNFVPKGKPTIVQQLQRISRGRRGGV